VGAAAALAVGRRMGAYQPATAPQGAAKDPAREMAAVLARIQAPTFPSRVFEITGYGARQGKSNDSTEAIRKAIEACAAAGGGRVVVPAGDFLTGAIHLRSKVNLHLEEGATLFFSTDPKQYLPLVYTRFEGTECMNFSPLIYAWEQTDLAVTGLGMLDGQADQTHWWDWKARDSSRALVAMGDKDVPVAERVFGEGKFLRPNFFQPYRSKNILVEGISIRNSPMWELNPVLCQNVTVRDVKINSHGPNNDGCDPESSKDVLVERCVFDTGDDCIAIKSGRNRDGRRVNVPAENIVVRDCTMKDGHGGVSLGSEGSGGIRNIFVDKCRMDSPHLNYAMRIKTNTWRGGVTENVYFTNTTVGEVSDSVLEITYFYPEGNDREGRGGPMQPVVRNVTLDHITSQKSKRAVNFRGYENAPITGIALEHCSFDHAAEDNVIEHVDGLKIEDVMRNGQPMQAEK
jgi:polygalacturonase